MTSCAGVSPAGVLQRRPVSPISNRAFPFKSRAKDVAGGRPPFRSSWPSGAAMATAKRGRCMRADDADVRKGARTPGRPTDRNFKFAALRWQPLQW